MIFNIQKCSIHDGDGLRTLVFFKGCPLRCPWCANPESQSYKYEIIESPNRCIGCAHCKEICPVNAIQDNGHIDKSLCPKDCFKCTDICYAEAKRIVGKEYTVEELYKEIQKDSVFYEIKGGGVTFSGGEPLTYGKYLAEIASKCKTGRINVVVESCGFGNYDDFKCALPYIDSMFMDVKIMDSEKHKKIIGADNELILENIRKISEYGIPITIRTPVVPGFTDSVENIAEIAKFVKTLPSVREYELLVYHNLGEAKYASLGMEYSLKGLEPPSDDKMRALTKLANSILQPAGKQCFYMKDNNKEVIIC